MINVANLTKYYADNLALDHASFEVQAGDVVGFLGPNGAGKSTAMKILTCFLPPSSGTAKVAGFDILEKPMEVRRRIGYMPENVPLYSEMRVREYLTFRAKIKDVPRKGRRARVDMVMERCWLSDRQRQTIGTLSKGYRQRVGLADAMVGDPELLILDEPTIGLDPNQVRQVRTLIRELGQDHTVVLSTHILPEVEIVCDRVIIINGGRIVMQERLDALRRNTGPEAEYYVEVLGPFDQVRTTIASVQGVRDMREHSHGDKGTPGFVIRVPRQGDAISSVVSAVIQKGWKVKEVRRRERTLEDIFIEVVGRDTAAAV